MVDKNITVNDFGEETSESIKKRRQEFNDKMLRQQKEYEFIRLKQLDETELRKLIQQEVADAKKLKEQKEIKADEIKPPLKEWQVIRLKRQAEAKAKELIRQKYYEAQRLNKPLESEDLKRLSDKFDKEFEAQILNKLLEPEYLMQLRDKSYKELVKKFKEVEIKTVRTVPTEFERQEQEKRIKEIEAKSLKEVVSNTESEARKIGQLLDLCGELIPTSVVKKIIADCRTLPFLKTKELPKGWLLTYQTLSDIFLSSFYWILKNDTSPMYLYSIKHKNYTHYTIPTLILIPESIASDYGLNVHANYSIDDYNNDINKHKKSNRYTAALLETIYFLLTNSEIKRSILQLDSPFRILHSVVELLIDMGAIDSALRLYKIDESIFNTPNRLSLLANKAVQSGNLDDSIRLVGKLIEKEPYHPSIPSIQAEIKRLEQRHRLKSTFSIDFSKVDELSGIEFENLLMDKFISMGFKAEPTPKTGDFGADLIIENNEGTRIIVQCKRFKSKVNLKAVQEVVGAMGHYAGDIGIVITNNSFLNSAVKLAESHDIELWDGDKLVSFLAGDLSFSEIINVIK